MSPFSEYLNPFSINTPLSILTATGLFLTSGDGGVFRFGNLWGCTMIVMCSSFSSSLDSPIGDHENSAKFGMAAGFLYAALPEIRMVRPVLPRRWRLGVGVFYMGFHGVRYYREISRIDDAGED